MSGQQVSDKVTTIDEVQLAPDETLDDLRCGGLRIIQSRDGYRFSLDPVLLCAFARIGAGEAVVDLGTGSGVIPLLLARRTAAGSIVGVEIQSQAADRAQRAAVLNGLAERISIIHRDLRDLRGVLAPESCDVVLSNPPFRPIGTGKVAPRDERAAARHELAGGLEDFLVAAYFLLKQGGRFYLIHLAERLAEVLAAMRRMRLEPKRLRCVYSRPGQGARLVLVEGRKEGRPSLTVEAPLYIYVGEGYSAEVLAMYGE
ncbi:tRNA1(Val) (adenine(37)-N6)-methyltransferase [Trichloromonas sp.]|uniref:tRNA1(Val) (adenine(37)-N6)-methyltransferase n=1 Tax=Trichloromonas sp. TaxID=3069249 RepID=UPI002A4111BD|nr:methyltransferase [Trichloromonas sp.]